MAEVTTPEKKRARIRHLTATEKTEAITLWKSGTVTLEDLCKRFKKDRSTFLRIFRELGVEKGSDAERVGEKVKEAVEKIIVDDAVILAKRIKETKEEHFRYMDGMVKLAWNTILEARQKKLPLATIATDMKALEMGMRIFKIGREEKYTLLGIRPDDENEDKPMPELVVQELTAQDIQDLHERSLMADDELGLNETLGDEGLFEEGGELSDSDRVETD